MLYLTQRIFPKVVYGSLGQKMLHFCFKVTHIFSYNYYLFGFLVLELLVLKKDHSFPVARKQQNACLI
ncbi:hypothetical protein XENTR_v10009344 [Xenopus tropicalis]|nr:hypothetical protein XENTR_v10009344 [Xenopus tropicalis]